MRQWFSTIALRDSKRPFRPARRSDLSSGSWTERCKFILMNFWKKIRIQKKICRKNWFCLIFFYCEKIDLAKVGWTIDENRKRIIEIHACLYGNSNLKSWNFLQTRRFFISRMSNEFSKLKLLCSFSAKNLKKCEIVDQILSYPAMHSKRMPFHCPSSIEVKLKLFELCSQLHLNGGNLNKFSSGGCFRLFHNSLLSVQSMSKLDFSSLGCHENNRKSSRKFCISCRFVELHKFENTRSQLRIYSAWRIAPRNYLKLGNLDVVAALVTKLKPSPTHGVNFVQTSHGWNKSSEHKLLPQLHVHEIKSLWVV